MKFVRTGIFYPFLLAIYSVLSLYSNNYIFVEPRNLARPLVVSLSGIVLVLVLLRTILKDWQKAGLITATATALFFSYGHLYLFLESSGFFLGRHRYLAPLWLVIFSAVTFWIARRKQGLESSAQTLNLISLFLLIMPTGQFASQAIRSITAGTEAQGNPIAASGENVVADRPDIYWIIFDGYSRADVLQSHYDYDNSEFISQLEQRGFYVAACSQSNYSWTHFSLTSALDLNYLDDPQALPAWRNTALNKILNEQDYLVIALDNGFPKTRELAPEMLIRAKDNKALSYINTISEFEALLLKTSMGLLITDAETFFPERFQVDVEHAIYVKHYWWTISFFEQLSAVAEMEEATFTMAHFLVPHDPYIFNPDGSFTSDRNIDPDTGYTNQVEYVNRQVIGTIDEILEKSASPPIIIMQGDHGWPWTSPEERLAILNAYHLPGDGNELLYETISPVNSFRLVLDHFLGYDFPLLEDVSQFSPEETLYDLSVVPNTCTTSASGS